MTLNILQNEIKKCTTCDIECNPIVGQGQQSKVMIVVDKPSLSDVQFNCPANDNGGLLEILLDEAGLSRTQVYITHTVKCYAPKHKVGHYRNCLSWLQKEIEQVDPKLIILMGQKPVEFLLGKEYKLDDMVGYLVNFSRQYFVEYGLHYLTSHPSKIEAAKQHFRSLQNATI